jgi:hypothetical protein
LVKTHQLIDRVPGDLAVGNQFGQILHRGGEPGSEANGYQTSNQTDCGTAESKWNDGQKKVEALKASDDFPILGKSCGIEVCWKEEGQSSNLSML